MNELKFKKIIFWNIGVYFCLTLTEILVTKGILILNSHDDYLAILGMVLSVFTIGLQILINLGLSIYSFVKGDSELGKAYLVSLFLILLIGYPLCYAGFTS